MHATGVVEVTQSRPMSSRLHAPRRWPAGLDLRCRTGDDLGALHLLLSQDDFQHNGATHDPFGSIDDAADFFQALPSHAFEVVARVHGAVAGYAGVFPSPGRQKHTGTITVCVDPAFQHRGVGSALVASLIATAWSMMELSRLQLTVFVDNTRAISLYERFGFRPEGRIVNFVRRPTGYVDAYLMALMRS